MFRYIFLIAAFISITNMACSKKRSKPSQATAFIDEKPKEISTPDPVAPSPVNNQKSPDNVSTESPQNPLLDPIVSEIASQNMNLYKSSAEALELANRITEVTFDAEDSHFSIKTYSDEIYNFKLEKSANRTLYFNYYKDKEVHTITYSCMVEDLSSTNSSSIYLITLKDIKTKAQIKILNVKKLGAISVQMLPRFDYAGTLIKDSQKLIERIQKTPTVRAEFYEILESSSTSQISRFHLVVSDFFKLNSRYSEALVRKNKITELPLVVAGMGGFKSIFKSAAYTSIKESFYKIETEKLNPVYYNQMHLEFILKQKPTSPIEDPKVRLEIQFH